MINLTIHVQGHKVTMTSDMYDPIVMLHSGGVSWGHIMDDIAYYAYEVDVYLHHMTDYCDDCGDCDICEDLAAYRREVARQVDWVSAEPDNYVLRTRIY